MEYDGQKSKKKNYETLRTDTFMRTFIIIHEPAKSIGENFFALSTQSQITNIGNLGHIASSISSCVKDLRPFVEVIPPLIRCHVGQSCVFLILKGLRKRLALHVVAVILKTSHDPLEQDQGGKSRKGWK